MDVPIFELKRQYDAQQAEMDAAIQRVLDAGWFVLGEQGKQFEVEFAAFLGAEHVVGVGSGTEAIHLALVALGIGPGDEVITTPLTAAATAMAVRFAGATPIFADVDADTATLDPADVARRITPRTRALLPVHLYGHPADVDPLLTLARDHNLSVIEDCAQAHGTRYNDRVVGTMGDIAAFSFYPSKNLGAYGDAGAVACRDADLAHKLRMLRNYGEETRYHHHIEGFNSRLDELQASILRARLPHLDAGNARRRDLAAAYAAQIRHPDIHLPAEQPWAHHVYHLYVVRAASEAMRDALRRHLTAQGIGTQIHYPIPLHRQKAFAGLGQPPGDCPVAEALADSILSLPIYPELTDAEATRVADAVNAFRPT